MKTKPTSRLLLRELRPSDASLLFSGYTSDAKVARYLPWRTHTNIAETHAMIAAAGELAKTGEAQLYTIALQKAPNLAIGLANLSAGSEGPALGLGLSRAYWGQGYGQDAVAALAEHIFRESNAPQLWAYCDVDNTPSARMLEKTGFKYQRIARGYAVHPQISDDPRDCFLFAMTRPRDE